MNIPWENKRANTLLNLIKQCNDGRIYVKWNTQNLEIAGTELAVDEPTAGQLQTLLENQLPEMAAGAKTLNEQKLLATNNKNVLVAMAANPNTSQTTIQKLTEHYNISIAGKAAQNPSINPQYLHQKTIELYQNHQNQSKNQILNPKALATERPVHKLNLLQSLLTNPSLTNTTLTQIAQHLLTQPPDRASHNHDLALTIAEHHNCSYETKKQLIEHYNLNPNLLLSCPDIPKETLNQINLNDNSQTYLAAKNPTCSIELLETIAANALLVSTSDLTAVAESKNLTEKCAQIIADQLPYSQYSGIKLLENPACPIEILQKIVQDPREDRDLRFSAIQNPTLANQLTAEQIKTYFEENNTWLKIEILATQTGRTNLEKEHIQILQQGLSTLLKPETLADTFDNTGIHILTLSCNKHLQTPQNFQKLLEVTSTLSTQENSGNANIAKTIIQLHLTYETITNYINNTTVANRLTIQKQLKELNITYTPSTQQTTPETTIKKTGAVKHNTGIVWKN